MLKEKKSDITLTRISHTRVWHVCLYVIQIISKSWRLEIMWILRQTRSFHSLGFMRLFNNVFSALVVQIMRFLCYQQKQMIAVKNLYNLSFSRHDSLHNWMKRIKCIIVTSSIALQAYAFQGMINSFRILSIRTNGGERPQITPKVVACLIF